MKIIKLTEDQKSAIKDARSQENTKFLEFESAKQAFIDSKSARESLERSISAAHNNPEWCGFWISECCEYLIVNS